MTERPTALVTGASRGVGEAVARALAPTHHVLLGGRDTEALGKLAGELPDARPWPVELTEVGPADVAGVERLDLLVHSAGVALLGHVAELTADTWRRTMEINVVAVAELTRLLLPALRAARGHVVCVNSGAGQRANPNWGAYAASKFALRAFADALRLEEPELRVTTVYPGRVDTDMQRGVREQEGGAYEPDRYLRADTVARAVLAAVNAGPDAHLTEITLRPSGGPVN
ncbi:SDR family oxidoreductase [Nonomuraea roseoviolacea subsp. roseoviolacea]|uniref:NADP-dependent 3-hydroxy acid dehydrogenase YdfG n=1 Tax=Nonomuraea roseoviolacea subsp. carminata TaxID=160689 RepID=A0ABT1JU72_9ACTN|nr:SDR family oxidoreductase [Nonomuraea roseoviolacea]MCP2345296.1 NADP-dependent 3-hydroxy acid dehydrogenase YdfG [Nonomuraea roseoviolacea subsp. carminata]